VGVLGPFHYIPNGRSFFASYPSLLFFLLCVHFFNVMVALALYHLYGVHVLQIMQDVSCIKELTTLYESATIEDLYLAYQHLKVDESSLFACIGIAGAESSEDTNGTKLLILSFTFSSK
jgi:hypothetical protein